MSLNGKIVLITGSARRLGKAFALGVAKAGGVVILHHAHSPGEATQTLEEIRALGGMAYVLTADLNDPQQASGLIKQASELGRLHALVNNAAVFEPFTWDNTDLAAWERHLNINLTAPFLLSQAFARQLLPEYQGRIVNILDWRALRPGADHFPYTISKAGLAALTRSLAIALAPKIIVNGLALGAVLPPSDNTSSADILRNVPAGRWAQVEEAVQALLFLLDGPEYITGEVIHLDGGRHLV